MSAEHKVLVVDGGGRGSALVDAYAKSQHVEQVLAVPGNDLMHELTDKVVMTFPKLITTDVADIVSIALEDGVSLVDVAQDNAVAVGLVDALREVGIPTVGPTRAAGEVEWSKSWAREFGDRHNLPQPAFHAFSTISEGVAYLNTQPDRAYFVKASGLAEGKGAIGARSRKEAKDAITELGRFGQAADIFLLEEWMQNSDGSSGEEFSTFALSDGQDFVIVGSAQDHKRAETFDQGENTGGMGAVSPIRLMTSELATRVERDVLEPTLTGLREEGRPYTGVLYFGGMALREVTTSSPRVVEFNARWGDPEAQVLLPGVKNDWFEVGMAIAKGSLRDIQLETDGKTRVAVTAATRGYPGRYPKGLEISGIDEVRKYEGITIFGAGVRKEEGKYFTAGGRLLYVIGEGDSVIEARQRAYGALAGLHVEGNNLQYRTDVGWRDVERIRTGGNDADS